eukprot:4305873-Pyramimonas_sp.AAC.1
MTRVASALGAAVSAQAPRGRIDALDFLPKLAELAPQRVKQWQEQAEAEEQGCLGSVQGRMHTSTEAGRWLRVLQHAGLARWDPAALAPLARLAKLRAHQLAKRDIDERGR